MHEIASLGSGHTSDAHRGEGLCERHVLPDAKRETLPKLAARFTVTTSRLVCHFGRQHA